MGDSTLLTSAFIALVVTTLLTTLLAGLIFADSGESWLRWTLGAVTTVLATLLLLATFFVGTVVL